MNMQAPDRKEWRSIRASEASMRMTNPIRELIQNIKMPTNGKELIALSIGIVARILSEG